MSNGSANDLITVYFWRVTDHSYLHLWTAEKNTATNQIEISAALFERFNRTLAEFEEVQDELRKLVEPTKE